MSFLVDKLVTHEKNKAKGYVMSKVPVVGSRFAGEEEKKKKDKSQEERDKEREKEIKAEAARVEKLEHRQAQRRMKQYDIVSKYRKK